MGEYLFLFRGGDDMGNDQSPEKWKQLMHSWMVWMADLQKRGQFLSAQPLSQTGKQVTGPQKAVSDKPFGISNEIVSGYLLLKATNYEEAVELARGCPLLEIENGKVEVREIQELKV